ncbi:MAG: HEPN domain-containing protein [Actinomycetota bacterium]
MTPRDLAQTFLKKALEDLKGIRRLAGDPEIDDALIGFHARQCAEKALKAILTAAEVRTGRTHELSGLIDLLIEDARIDPPDWLREIDVFSPYAVTWRYTELEADVALDRAAVEMLMERTLEWAAARVEEIDSK